MLGGLAPAASALGSRPPHPRRLRSFRPAGRRSLGDDAGHLARRLNQQTGFLATALH